MTVTSNTDALGAQQRFSTENVLNTLMTYLADYKSFTSSEQMKRVVSLMHRMAVKASCDHLFFRATRMELFRRILDDRPHLPKEGPYKDLLGLIGFVLKKFFKIALTNKTMFIEVSLRYKIHSARLA